MTSGLRLALAALVLGSATVTAQGMNDQLKQTVAAAKATAARNQQALRSYAWVTKTTLYFKGELKNTKLEACQYASDGQLQKTLLGDPPPPPEKGSGLKGKAVANKTEEMKNDLESAAALVHAYLPPAPERLQAVIAAGKVSITPAAGTAVLRFADYQKRGDALTLTLDSAAKSMRAVAVETWLDEPKNKVTLDVALDTLPDGTSYTARVVLKIPGSDIEVRVTNSNYLYRAP